jgi:membrane protease YdiL (CAAX protease family)
MKVPVVVRAALTATGVAFLGSVPFAILVTANTKHASSVPWAALPTAAYLWLYWKYFVQGRGLPVSTQLARRTDARANAVASRFWGFTLVTGVLGLATIVLFQAVLNRVVALPQQRDLDPSQFNALTLVVWVVTGAVVSGVVEETAFRGYLQAPIERRHGLTAAILATGILFGLAHFTHPEVGLTLLPYYMVVAGVYGGIAYATNSTLPTMFLHAGGNALGELLLLRASKSEWQLAGSQPQLISKTGLTLEFIALVLGFIVVGATTIWAVRSLAQMVRERRVP